MNTYKSSAAFRRALEERLRLITHPLPQEMPDPPAAWVKTFQKLAGEVTLNYQTLEEANIFFKRFLDPILSDEVLLKWHPDRWGWE